MKKLKGGKILFIIGWPLNHGGHIHDALNHIKYLRKYGLEIFLLAPNGNKIEEFTDLGTKYYTMPKSYPLTFLLILYLLLIKKVDVIHAMDYEAIKKAIIVKIVIKKPIIFTKAGGPAPSYKLPPVDALIVCSSELYEQLTPKVSIESSIYLIKERIDLSIFKPCNNIRQNSKTIVFMAMRLERQKTMWLDNIIEQIRIYSSELEDYQFIIAGEGGLFKHYVKLADEINKRSGSQTIKLIGGIDSVTEMNKLYNSSDIVIGHGRGIMEAMACGKIVLVLGEESQIEEVSRDNVDEISYYNFSGRHFRYRPSISNTSIMSSLININPINTWSEAYIKENYSAEVGAWKLIQLYRSLTYSRNSLIIVKWLFNHK